MASQDIADDIRFIRQYLKVVAEKDERLSTGTLVHSRAYVEACAGWLPQTVTRYLRHLRQITECELAMTAAGRHEGRLSPNTRNCAARRRRNSSG